jgi:hypothetical protein
MSRRSRVAAIVLLLTIIGWCAGVALSGTMGGARLPSMTAAKVVTKLQPSVGGASRPGMPDIRLARFGHDGTDPLGALAGTPGDGAGLGLHSGMPNPGRTFMGSLGAAATAGLVFFVWPPIRRAARRLRNAGAWRVDPRYGAGNRRMSRRIPSDPPARLSLSLDGGPAADAWLDNMSLSGVALDWNGAAYAGQHAVLAIRGAQPILATVVAQDGSMLRLKFDGLSRHQAAEIVRLRAHGIAAAPARRAGFAAPAMTENRLQALPFRAG